MKRTIMISAIAIAVASSGAVAWASGTAGSRVAQPAGAQVVHLATPLDTSTESKFTPIPPCRAVDTRYGGGAMANNTSRHFLIGGSSSMHSQGGPTTGCGVPAQATAVSVTITTVASASGYLKACAYGASEPPTSFLNFTKLFNAAVGGVVSMGSGQIWVKDRGGPTQVIVDVTGYYLAPMTAFVNTDGTLNHGSRVVSTAKLTLYGPGVYQVDFDRDVSHCTYAASNYDYSTGVLVEPRSGDATGVFVETVNNSGALTDSAFYLTVTC